MTSTEHQSYRENVIIAVLLTCVGLAFYSIGDAGLKIIRARLNFVQVILIVNIFNIFFMIAYGWLSEGKKAFCTKKPKLMFLRAVINQVGMICSVIAFPHMHLTTFYTLIFTSPFWVAILSSYFLKDALGVRRLLVILFGFAVVLFIFRPGGGIFNIWSFLILLAAFFNGCQLVVIRHIGTEESRPFMIMSGSVMSIVVTYPFLGDNYIPPTLYEWGLFLMMAVMGCIALLCISYAIQMAPSASIVAPYHYTQMIWGVLLGYWIFNEVPSMEIIVGSILIILAGIYLIRSETRDAVLKLTKA
ncbi:MAG: DMT family transporter [Alphaproteobacteria bacterium]|nr:DMT family transporter [Alphaproteobacteria bacterium]